MAKIKLGSILFISFLTVGLIGCSKLEFAPAEDPIVEGNDKTSDKKRVHSESFTASGDYSDKSVDVLIVVDNSYSMEEEQQKMGERLGSFIDSLNGIDWQIGITTTDVSNGRYGIQGRLLNLEGAPGYILNAQTPNYETVFRNTIYREETIDCFAQNDCPSGDEMPLAAIIDAVQRRNAANAGFFRDSSDLAIIVLSDEDEDSDGPPSATSPESVLTAIASVFPSKTVTAFGIITPVGDDACAADNELPVDVYSRFVDRLVSLTGGVVGSICDSDYSKSLTKIGERVLEKINHVVLMRAPDPKSVIVEFVPPIDVDVSVNGKRLEFSKEIPEGTKINVNYEEVDMSQPRETEDDDDNPEDDDDDQQSSNRNDDKDKDKDKDRDDDDNSNNSDDD